MATFNVTISESVNLFGPEPPNVWGTMEWGHNWGYGNVDFITQVEKSFSETVTLSDDFSPIAQFFRTVEETITLTDDMDQTRQDANGYFRLFGNKQHGDDRVLTSHTAVSDPSTDYDSVSDPSTDWTET